MEIVLIKTAMVDISSASATPPTQSKPVDRSVYNTSELRELHFECYAVAIPDLGIAVAAALGLAKVATMAITIYVKGMEAFFMMTKNPPQKLQEWCSNKVPQLCGSNRRKCVRLTINGICSTVSSTLLIFVAAITLAGGMIVITDLNKTDMKPLTFLSYLAYFILPMLIYFPLGYAIVYIQFHCEKGEYVSFAADQKPLDPADWDVESGPSVTVRQHVEASMRRESDNINGEGPDETEESWRIDISCNTRYGAIQNQA